MPTPSSTNTPVHYELFHDLQRQNAHLRRNNWLHWIVQIAFVALFVLIMLRPLSAVRVNPDGSPEMLSTVPSVNYPGPEEAEYVSRQISTHLLELTSGSVQRDLAKGFALMTAQFQSVYQKKVTDDPTLASLEKGNVRSVLDFDATKTTIRAEKDGKGLPTKYFVELVGRLRVYRADVLTGPLAVRYLALRTTLLLVPRSKNTLNGLLVDWFDKEVIEAPKGAPTVDANPLSPAPGPRLGGSDPTP